jgi:hypothetical protein
MPFFPINRPSSVASLYERIKDGVLSLTEEESKMIISRNGPTNFLITNFDTFRKQLIVTSHEDHLNKIMTSYNIFRVLDTYCILTVFDFFDLESVNTEISETELTCENIISNYYMSNRVVTTIEYFNTLEYFDSKTYTIKKTSDDQFGIIIRCDKIFMGDGDMVFMYISRLEAITVLISMVSERPYFNDMFRLDGKLMF